MDAAPDGPMAPLRMVVLGDSTAFVDETGPQDPGCLHLWPNVAAVAIQKEVDRVVNVSIVARPGQTVRDTWTLVAKDRHVQHDVLPHADIIVVAIGSFDHAPAGVPAWVEAVVPYLYPTPVRRRARSILRALYPKLVRLRGGRQTRTPAGEFDRLYRLVLQQVRGWSISGSDSDEPRAILVALGPTSHRSDYYGNRHPGHGESERRQLAIAAKLGFAPIAVWDHVDPEQLNPDGIHWHRDAHALIGAATASATLKHLLS